MKQLFLSFIAIFFAQLSIAQQFGEIYGLEFRTSELRLARVEPSDGQVTVLSNNPTSADQFGSGISDVDPIGNRYFYIRFGQIITVDLTTGNVLHSPTVTCPTHSFNVVQPISNIAYSPVDGIIYGVLHYGSSLWFASIDPATGVMNVLSNGPISADMYQSGVADIDPNTGRYFYVRNNMIYTVDVTSSTVVESHTIQNPNGATSPFTNIAYNWLTDELFGLEYIGAQWGVAPAEMRLVTVDPYTGAHTILSNAVLSADQFSSGVSDIDPAKDQYYYIRANAILTVSLSTGDLLEYKSLSNPNNAIAPITNIEVLKDYVITLPPTASFQPSNTGMEVSFKNTSAYALYSNWDFGDGTTSTEKHPTHLYTTPGTYTVTLTTECIDGRQEVIVENVEVTGSMVNVEEESLPEISYYPNPANDILTISSETSGWVTLTDLKGAIIMEKQLLIGTNELHIDQFADGIYQLTIGNETGILLQEKVVLLR